MPRHPRLFIYILTVWLALPLCRARQTAPRLDLAAPVTDAAETLPNPEEVKPPSLEYSWKALLRGQRLNVRDTSVHYPRFIEFCLNVYRWAEDNFNTYDPDYVTGTGKHGKIRLVNDNWLDSYIFKISGGIPIVMATHPFSNIGISANYSILSLGFSVDLNTVLPGEKTRHKKIETGFSCARLMVDGYFWENAGKTTIRRIGAPKMENLRSIPFDGIDFRALGAIGLYIFNYKKFSLPAAYNLSSYQKRSAGSWLVGLQGTFYNCDFNFAKLPGEVITEIDLPFDYYRFNYNSVNVMGGYSFNWVLGHHWLYNITAIPGLGMTFSQTDSSEGQQTLASATVRGMTSLTYTNRQFFVTGTVKFDGNMFLTKSMHFLSGIGNGQCSVGVRF